MNSLITKYNESVAPIARVGFSSLCGFSQYGLDIEIAPTQFGTWSPTLVLPVASSYQSLFFSTNHNLFRSISSWQDHLKMVDVIAQNNNCPYLVLGSPAARNASAEFDIKVSDLKKSEYYLAGALSELNNVTMIGLEANPAIYNSNVCVDAKTTLEVVKLVRMLGNENIYFHLDSGCLRANQEEPLDFLDPNFVKRIHISEPGLLSYSGNEFELIRTAIRLGIGVSLEQKAGGTGAEIFISQVEAAIGEL